MITEITVVSLIALYCIIGITYFVAFYLYHQKNSHDYKYLNEFSEPLVTDSKN